MIKVKQQLYELLLSEFKRSPNYALAKTIFLFCQDNEGFDFPDAVNRTFVEGIRNEEVRAFGLRYGRNIKSGPRPNETEEPAISALAGKAEFEKLVLQLSVATEKTYSPKMVKQISSPVKGGLSYDDILEMFVVAGNPID